MSSDRLRESATHTTQMPTATTTTVAIRGTMKFRSSHSGIQAGRGMRACTLLWPKPSSRGAMVPLLGAFRYTNHSRACKSVYRMQQQQTGQFARQNDIRYFVCVCECQERDGKQARVFVVCFVSCVKCQRFWQSEREREEPKKKTKFVISWMYL